MVAYCTVPQVRAVLTRDQGVTTGTAAELGDVAIQAAIDDGTATLDIRLANRYNVPWPAPVPLIITRLCVAFAAYHADLQHRQSEDLPSTDPSALRYKWAQEMLSLLSTGNADIPDAQISNGIPTGMVVVNAYSGQLFTADDFDLTIAPDDDYARVFGPGFATRW